MKAKRIIPLLVLSVAFFGTLVSCSSKKTVDDLQQIYELAVKEGYNGTYEEWLDFVKGDKGDKGDAGKDGTGIANVELLSDGTLVLTMSNGEKISVGNVKGPSGNDGKSVTNAKIENGKLVLVFSDNSEITVGNVVGATGPAGSTGAAGKDGVGIKNVTINEEGHLVITLTEGNPVDLGNVVGATGATGATGAAGKDGVGIKTITINEAGHLIVTLTEGNPIDLGCVTGNSGATGTDGKDGVGVESTTIDETGHLIIVTTDGVTHDLGVVVGTSGTDGLSAFDLYIETHPEYEGDEAQWLDDLVNGRLGNEELKTIKYVVDGVEVSSVSAKVGKGLVKPENPTKEGYTFKGWVDPDGNLWNFYGNVVTCDMELTAVFEVNYYTIHFAALGNSGSNDFAYGTTIFEKEVPFEMPAYNGAPFVGWYSTNLGGYVTSDYVVSQEDTLTATWQGVHALEVSDGVSEEPYYVYVSETNVLSQIRDELHDPVKEGFIFKGYALEDGTVITDETSLSGAGANLKVHAIWESEIAGSYRSADSSSYTLKVDESGLATYVHYSRTYTGQVNYVSENTYEVNAESTSGNSVNIIIHKEMDGVYGVNVSGYETYHLYFYDSTAIDSKELGVNYTTKYHRVFINKSTGEYAYFACPGSTELGEKVNVEVISGSATTTGSVIRIYTDEDIEGYFAKISSFYGNGGLQLAQYRGVYEGGLELDGFAIYSSKRGVAIYQETTYDYYFINDNTIQLCTEGSSTKVKCVGVDTTAMRAYEITPTEGSSILGVKVGQLSYSSISTSVYLDLDANGIGTYKNSSTYYGRLVKNEDETYTFQGKTDSSSPKNITVTIEDLGEGFVTFTDGSKSGVLAPSTSTLCKVGNGYSDYVISVTYNTVTKHFYQKSSSSQVYAANVTFISGDSIATAGTQFSVSVGEETKVALAKVVTPNSTDKGYILPDALKGDYKLTEDAEVTLTLDGFANLSKKTEGVATLNGVVGTYKMFTDTIIEVTVNDVTTKYSVDTASHLYSTLATVDVGVFAGTYTQIVPGTSSAMTLVVNEDGTAVYTRSSSSVYKGTVSLSEDKTSFTLEGYTEGSAYTSTYTIKSIEASGRSIIVTDSSDKQYVFVKGANSTSFIGGVSSSVSLVFSATFGEEVVYYYASTDKAFVESPVTVRLASDSPSAVTLGAVNSIIEVVDSKDNVIFVGKVKTANSTSGLVAANLDERNTFTDGGNTLFTDGFTTENSVDKRGKAVLAGVSYTYYYPVEIDNTIYLYDAEGNKSYVTYDPSTKTYKVAEVVLDDSSFFLKTMTGMNASSYKVTMDKYGYGTMGGSTTYTGKFTFNESKTEFTFVGKYCYKTTTKTVKAVGKVLDEGVIIADFTDGSESSCQYYTTGTSSQYGKGWANFLYVVKVGDVETYYYAPDRDGNASTYVGKVKVEVLNGKGVTIGSVVKVASLDGLTTYLTCKLVKVNGSAGYELQDAYAGTYTCGDSSITLDGFGNATMGETVGTYTISGSEVTATIGEKVYSLVNNEFVEATFDALFNKTASAAYNFYAGYSSYEANTSFKFDGKGNVTVTSSSSEMDSDYSAPSYYSCPFAGTGTYVIEGTTVTVSVKGYTIVFTLDSESAPTKLTCSSTTVSSSSNGYFASGTEFTLK